MRHPPRNSIVRVSIIYGRAVRRIPSPVSKLQGIGENFTMKTLALFLFTLCALDGARGQDDPAELKGKIDQAIDKGVEWLKGRQKPEGHFGESSGPTYAPGQAYHNKPG